MIIRIRPSLITPCARITQSLCRKQTNRAHDAGDATRRQRQQQLVERDAGAEPALLTLQTERHGRPGSSHKDERHAETSRPVLKQNPYASTYRLQEGHELGPVPDSRQPQASRRLNTPDAVSPRSIDGSVLKRKDPAESTATKSANGAKGSGVHRASGKTSAPNAPSRATSLPPGAPLSAVDAQTDNWSRQIDISGDFRLSIRRTSLMMCRPGEMRLVSWHRLRDACRCSQCVDPSTRQRVHTSPEAYREIETSIFVEEVPGPAVVYADAQDGSAGLRIEWSPGHTSFYTSAYLQDLAFGLEESDLKRLPHATRIPWDKEVLLSQSDKLYVQYADLASSDRRSTLLDTLVQLQRFGVVIIKGVPTDKTDDKNCSLREVMGWIGELRNSFYGETWDVKNVANSKNVAYTNLNLGLHMDLLYFSSPPRFQALHCLRNRVEGGSSYLVDAFAAAETFDANGHESVPIRFEYDNDSHYLTHEHPLISGDLKSLRTSHKSAVNWSPPFQGIPVPVESYMPEVGPKSLTHWYRQLSAFQSIIDEPHRRWEFLMEEGDLMLFDNRRVLHARKAFRDLTPEEAEARGVKVVEGEPSRWLKGCYLDGEVVWDKLVTLARDQ